MPAGLTPETVVAISAPVITTYVLARLDFRSETAFIWTGLNAFKPTGQGDALLDGNTFDPLVHGVVVDLGENTFTMQGSNELTVSLNIPTDASLAIAAASIFPNEYQARQATLWRAILIKSPNPLAEPVWVVRKIRTGTMDKVEIQADGNTHKFILTIESHQSRITNASNQTYLNQKSIDAADTSQDYAVSIANGDPAPSKAPAGGAMGVAPGGGGAGAFGGVGGYFLRQYQ